ncbi:OsmC family peroxiredoxin [Microbacterium protaetiae]|uniref:OsmC family peroxiredoxin n=1 Tax=Microbacterium protaetiae TaxID=2509458 RepID=A0A4P6EAZ0_9MICO|nr:OsmC family protein [Microbacterium protaetiae]QAY58686.1 OsmC family peroxiredoxin [Microbacterium protaetiae]
MFGEHHYRVHADWNGNRGAGTTGYRDYDRLVTLRIPGKPDLAASSDKPFRGDPSRWNPEDLLLAALSECHLLSYLHACVGAGVVVTSYEDDATGVMTEDGKGGGAFTEVVLRPRVTVAAASMIEPARAAHHQAHEWCFIANSVNFPVRVQPEVIDVRAEEPA